MIHATSFSDEVLLDKHVQVTLFQSFRWILEIKYRIAGNSICDQYSNKTNELLTVALLILNCIVHLMSYERTFLIGLHLMSYKRTFLIGHMAFYVGIDWLVIFDGLGKSLCCVEG